MGASCSAAKAGLRSTLNDENPNIVISGFAPGDAVACEELADTHGHHVGDELLVTLSQRMKEALRDGDTLARIGGDEFIIVMVDLEKLEDSEPVFKRLLKAAAEPVIMVDVVVQVSTSIGVSLFLQDGVDADPAIYVAKRAGKNRYHLFDAAQEL